MTNTLRAISTGRKVKIINVRKPAPEQLSMYREECRAGMYFGTDDDFEIILNHVSRVEIFKFLKRSATGSFPSGNDQIWLISETEQAQIQAIEKGYTEAIQEKKAIKDHEAETKKQALITEAKELGHPVVMNSYITHECHNDGYDCSFDMCAVLIDENGKISKKYTCCY